MPQVVKLHRDVVEKEGVLQAQASGFGMIYGSAAAMKHGQPKSIA